MLLLPGCALAPDGPGRWLLRAGGAPGVGAGLSIRGGLCFAVAGARFVCGASSVGRCAIEKLFGCAVAGWCGVVRRARFGRRGVLVWVVSGSLLLL